MFSRKIFLLKSIVLFFYIGSIAIIFISCNLDTKGITPDSQVKGLVVITKSDDINNPIYIGKLPNFQNYLTRDYLTNKVADTIQININPWDLLTVGARNNVLDTLIVKQGDTLYVELSKKKLHKTFPNGVPEQWKYGTFLENNCTKKRVDSLYSSFYQKVSLPNGIKPLDTLFEQSGKYLILWNTELRQKKSFLKDDHNRFKSLVKESMQLVQEADKAAMYSIDSTKLKHLSQYFKESIIDRLLWLNSEFPKAEIEKYFNSEVYRRTYRNNSYGEYKIIFRKVNQIGKKIYQKKEYLENGDFKSVYDSLPKFIDSLWLQKAEMIALEQIFMSKSSLQEKRDYLTEFRKYGETDFEKYAKQAYMFNMQNIYESSFELFLKDVDGESYSWEELKKTFLGKVLYVDFWASWCSLL